MVTSANQCTEDLSEYTKVFEELARLKVIIIEQCQELLVPLVKEPSGLETNKTHTIFDKNSLLNSFVVDETDNEYQIILGKTKIPLVFAINKQEVNDYLFFEQQISPENMSESADGVTGAITVFITNLGFQHNCKEQLAPDNFIALAVRDVINILKLQDGQQEFAKNLIQASKQLVNAVTSYSQTVSSLTLYIQAQDICREALSIWELDRNQKGRDDEIEIEEDLYDFSSYFDTVNTPKNLQRQQEMLRKVRSCNICCNTSL